MQPFEHSNGIRRLELLVIQNKTESTTSVYLALCGKMTANGIGELRREVDDALRRNKCVHLDMGEVTLLDRVSAEFLNSLNGPKIAFENCPGYLRPWISRLRN